MNLIHFRLISFALLASTASAQDIYLRAIYTQWKPGMQQEGQRFITDVASKTAVNWLKADADAVGQVTMSRVLPGGNEIAYDRLRLVMTNKPPTLGGGGQPGSYLEGTGLTPAEFTGKLNSFMTTVRTEIWQSIYRHGSIKQGDFVQVRMMDPPAGKTAAFLDYTKNYESAMRAQIVKDGPATGMEMWRLRLVPEEAADNFVGLVVYPNSEAVYKSFGNREALFRKVHPGKDYHAYREAGDAVTHAVRYVTYRVDLAAWK